MFYNELIQKMITRDPLLKPHHVFFFKDFANAHYVYVIGSHESYYESVECVHCYRECSVTSWGTSRRWIPKQLGVGSNSNGYLEKMKSKVGSVEATIQICSTVQPAYPSFFLAGDTQRDKGFYRNLEAQVDISKIGDLIEARKQVFEEAFEKNVLVDFRHSPVEDKNLSSLFHLVNGSVVTVSEPIIKLNKNLELF